MAIIHIDTIRTVDHADITSAYLAFGAPTGTNVNWRMFRFINNTDGDILISIDGTTDNLFIPAMSFVLYDVAANAAPIAVTDDFVVGAKVQWFLKYSTAPSKGAIWLEGIYAVGV